MQTLILDSTGASIQVAMSTSATTTNPTFTASYADNNGTTFTEGANRGALAGSTDVTVVGNPASGYRRVVKDITIYNGDSAAVTIFIKYDVSATQRTIAKLVLQVGDTWNFSGAYDTNGNLKTVVGSVNLASQVTGTLPVANGGTGATTLTGVLKGNGTSAFTAATAGTDYLAPPSGTAILKANSGGALANATAGTDYLAPPSGTAILKANSGGALANATAGTDYLAPPSGTAILKANSGGALANATAGTDYGAPGTASTWTASQRGTVTTANTGAYNMNTTNNWITTPTGTVTLTFTNITAGQSGFITLVNGSNYTIAKDAAVKVASGQLTTLSATGTYLLSYHSPDGTNVYLTATAALS